MARWAGDGSLTLEGRKDRWGNLNGHHVDLAKIEAELQDLEVIREAYLQATVQAGRRRLIAHVVPVQDEGIDDERLRSSVGTQGALVTRHLSFAQHPDLPRTLTGLVDERALALRLEHASRDRSETEPQTPEEKALAEIWKEVLGLPDVGVQDKFFDLGGHSLLAVQVTLRLEEEKGLRIDPRTLFFESLGQVAAGAIPLSAKPSPGG
jgi:acyl carrier protein